MPPSRLLAALLSLALLPFAAPPTAHPAPTAPAIVALALPPEADAAPPGVYFSAGALDPALRPRILPDGSYSAPPDDAAASTSTAPLTLLREGWLRGTRVGVYAVRATADTAEAASLAAAAIPGARPLPPATRLAHLDTTPFATGAPAPDPAAARPAWKIRVERPGIQQLDAATLEAAGVRLDQLDPARLQLRYRGTEVALEELRGAGGALAALRFYAEPGDRWNAASVFWLTVGETPGLRMATRGAQTTGASVSTTAIERGAWRGNGILETRLPGPDGDRFFTADLRIPATRKEDPPPPPDFITTTLTTALPPAPGTASLTVSGDSVSSENHALRVTLGGEAQTYQWQGTGVWSTTRGFAERDTALRVELLPLAQPDGSYRGDRIHLDGVRWELPVALELGGQGARFVGDGGRRGYRLAGMAGDAAVYELSDPARPVRLAFSGDTFEDDAPAPRPYLATGPGTLHAPAIAAHAPVDMSQPLDVEAIYIAPSAFIPGLEPLLALRRAQGLTVAAVSTEAIYDAWSFGQLDPEAIRSFLRFAAERWQVAPHTVALVGDGSSDPRNYLGRGNTTWVPPYLADADPGLRETACEACYARLHGTDPLADGLPDLTFGRIPAKSVSELEALVRKIVGYEQNASPGLWRATIAFVGDNPDLGGDFHGAIEESVAEQPAHARIARILYDPAAPADDPWRVADPLVALGRSMGAFDAGAAVVQYVGHGLQFQWGYTAPPRVGGPTDRQYLLGLFGVDELRNGPWLPVVLSMSCLTGSFQIPAFSGTAIDERLVARPDGGAIAAWGSTGLGVLYGHNALQRGFYRALWAGPGKANLGALTMAGYLELFTAERCCQESISTFALLGDPLTTPRVQLDVHALRLPLVRR